MGNTCGDDSAGESREGKRGASVLASRGVCRRKGKTKGVKQQGTTEDWGLHGNGIEATQQQGGQG